MDFLLLGIGLLSAVVFFHAAANDERARGKGWVADQLFITVLLPHLPLWVARSLLVRLGVAMGALGIVGFIAYQ